MKILIILCLFLTGCTTVFVTPPPDYILKIEMYEQRSGALTMRQKQMLFMAWKKYDAINNPSGGVETRAGGQSSDER